jgi:CubicO group peptidase (beta-lactamase class C family)
MKSYLMLLFIILSPYLTFAQTDQAALCEQVIDSILAKDLNAETPGGAVGVIYDGKVIFKKVYGLSNLDYHLPMSLESRFNLASVSKQFTGFCCLQLAREGKIDLDADIHTYLPDMPDYGEKITLREMLHHTSGLATTDVLQLFAGNLFEKDWGMDEEFDMLHRYTKLNFKPNSEHLYSNCGYSLAAVIIEKITGKSFNENLAEIIFLPLGMTHSEVYDERGKVMANRASGYVRKDSVFQCKNNLSEYKIGSTDLYTTIDDMLRWNLFLLNPPAEKREIIDQLFYPSDTLASGDTISYTYGFNTWNYKGQKIAEHGGLTSGFLTRNILFPDLNFAMTAMFNIENVDIWNTCMQTADSLLKTRLKLEPIKERLEVKIDPKIYSDYAGDFYFPNGMRLTFEVKDDTLWLLIPGAPRFRMVPESKTEFFLRELDIQCTFVKTDRAVDQIIWHQSGQNTKGLRIVKVKELSVQEQRELTGRYFQPQIEVVYTVTLENNQLYIQLPQTFKRIVGIDPKAKLIHMGDDRFFIDQLGIVEFQRQSPKKTIGLVFMDVGRMRNIEFVKL